ncbi:MAG: hypothetical protein HQL76_09745 [Magnetococcales bacterium]|nr:hypothetical protein [Magnetococcales bacterium]
MSIQPDGWLEVGVRNTKEIAELPSRFSFVDLEIVLHVSVDMATFEGGKNNPPQESEGYQIEKLHMRSPVVVGMKATFPEG